MFKVGWKCLQHLLLTVEITSVHVLTCVRQSSSDEYTVKFENNYVFRQHFRTPSTAE